MDPSAEEFIRRATDIRDSHHTKIEEAAQNFPTSFVATALQHARTAVATCLDDTELAEEEARIDSLFRGQVDDAIERMARSMLPSLTARAQAELVVCKEDLGQLATTLDAICASLKEGTGVAPELATLMSATLTSYIDSAEARIKRFNIQDKLHVSDIMMLDEFDAIQREIGISDFTMETVLSILVSSIPVLPGFEDIL